jgi:hypothetical protein
VTWQQISPSRSSERSATESKSCAETSTRAWKTNARLDQTNERLGQVEHGLSDLGQFIRGNALDQAKHERFHAHHVERLEEDVTDLKARVQRLEDRAST